MKYIPYAEYEKVKPMGDDCESIIGLFELDFFCKEEMKNGCNMFETEGRIFVLPIKMFEYIATHVDLKRLYQSFKESRRAYNPVIVQNWKTETFLIIGFEWTVDKQTILACLQYTNYPLKIGFGIWKTEALSFIRQMQNSNTWISHEIYETNSDHWHI